MMIKTKITKSSNPGEALAKNQQPKTKNTKYQLRSPL